MIHYNFAQHQQPPQVLLLVCKLYRVQRSKTPPQLFTVDVLKRAVLYHAQDIERLCTFPIQTGS